MEADLVKRAGVPYREIAAAGLHGVGLRSLPGNLMKLWRGYWQARRVLREYRPDALFFTGGYVAVPMALAGIGLPSVTFVPDIEPGLALKLLARITNRIVVATSDSIKYFGRKSDVTVTGYPVRPDLQSWDLDEARQALGLSAELPTLLVFGGSKGARSINNALLAILPELLATMQVVHVSGRLDWPRVQAAQAEFAAHPDLPPDHLQRYHAFPYLHEEMGAALMAASLVVSRAGAATLGEFPLFGLPAILVPYPHAWRYQRVNAQYLVRHGGAVIVEDSQLEKGLLPTITRLVGDTREIARMREAMQSLATPTAAQSISRLFHNLVDNDERLVARGGSEI